MCNPDFDLAGQAMQRYLECERDCISGTSATFILPVKEGLFIWAQDRVFVKTTMGASYRFRLKTLPPF